jgi:mono/diheme cytochrome c family protein
MPRTAWRISSLVVAVLLGLGGCRDEPEAPVETITPADLARYTDAADPAFYTHIVRPMFVRNCGHCHFGWSHRGGLAMDTKAAILKGGKDGAVIVPGDPDRSLMMKTLRHEPGPKPMPLNRKLSDVDIDAVARWIKAGAVIPDDPGR